MTDAPETDDWRPNTAPQESDEQLLARAETTKGCRILVVKYNGCRSKIAKLEAKLVSHKAMAAARPNYPDYASGTEASIRTEREEMARAIESIRTKLTTADSTTDSGPTNVIVGEAQAFIEAMLAATEIDADISSLLRFTIPEIYGGTFSKAGQWYQAVPDTANSAVKVEELVLAERVARALSSLFVSRTVGTALEIVRTMENESDRTALTPVLRSWNTALRNYSTLYTALPADEGREVREDLIPCLIDGEPALLDRRTGNWNPPIDPNDLVLYPAVVADSNGETRALDAYVAHHFKTTEEVHAFYLTCGISLFAYGVPNLVFLLGQGGSGKDALFHLMKTAAGPGSWVSVDSKALTGEDEAGDLVRLRSARFAFCSFESAHGRDGSMKTNTLKTLTAGGMNPVTARAKYARESVDVYYRGSLWLYGNHAPNLAASGDFDGLDRRLVIMPIRAKLDRKAAPPSGFVSWEDAIQACAPVFAWRCLEAFVSWHRAGTPGYSDSRLRMPPEWAKLTEESMFSGSYLSFIRDLFVHDAHHGLPVTVVMEVLSAVKEMAKVPRSDYLTKMRERVGRHVRFEDEDFMATVTRDGVEYLPVTVNPYILEQVIGLTDIVPVKGLLKQNGWDESIQRAAYNLTKSYNNRFRRMLKGEWDDVEA